MKNKRIKIFVDAHILDMGYHGTHTFVRELYTGLMDRYPELDIYFGTYDTALVQSIFPKVAPSRLLLYKKRRPAVLRFLLDIPAYIRLYRFDFAHYQYLGVQWPTSCISIVTLHDVLFKDHPDHFPLGYRMLRGLLFGNSIRTAGIKTTVSGYSKDRIALHYRIPGEEIHIIPNAVVAGSARPSLSRKEAEERILAKYGIGNFLLYVSRIEPRKNHLLLLDIYFSLELHKQGIQIVFIGMESIRIPEMDKLIRGLNPEQRKALHWFRQVSGEDLDAFYTACRLFVYPSKAEGFGIPPLEAALHQAPVLCSRETAMESYRFFEPYTFDASSRLELSVKLSEMIRRPPGTDFLRDVSEKVKELYSRENSAKAFYSLIRKQEQLWD